MKFIKQIFIGLFILLAISPLIIALSLIFLPLFLPLASSPEAILWFSIIAMVIYFFILIQKSEQHDSLKEEVNSLSQVKTVSIASLQATGYSSVQITGQVICHSPLISEIAEISCIYYKSSISWECGYGEDSYDHQIQKEYCVPYFLLQDNTGTLVIKSENAEINAQVITTKEEVLFQHGQIIATKSSKVLGTYRCNFLFPLSSPSFLEVAIPLNCKIYVIGQLIREKNELFPNESLALENFSLLQAQYIGFTGQKALIRNKSHDISDVEGCRDPIKLLGIIGFILLLVLFGLALFMNK